MAGIRTGLPGYRTDYSGGKNERKNKKPNPKFLHAQQAP
jgi:hypothetical protein